jgi:beta-glucosidase
VIVTQFFYISGCFTMGLDTVDLANWSIDRLAAQMIVVRTTGFLFDHQVQYPQWEANTAKLRQLVELGIGGVIFLGGSAAELALKTAELQDLATKAGSVPLFLCADIEEGLGQRFSGATWFAPPMALNEIFKHNHDRAITLAQAMGRATAIEARAVGLNWILGPIVDVNNNPANPVINIRAFGEDAATVCALTQGFIRGAAGHGVLTCAKHFPGHGDTDLDSHLTLPRIEHDRPRLEQVEFLPFQGAIAHHIDAIMTAHLEVPAIDPNDITTFSHALNTTLLREQWGFEGIIVTDALVMGAIEQRYGNRETAIRVVEGGADLLMMPVDPIGAIEAIVQAVESGRISRTQLETSVQRILAAKDRIFIPIHHITLAGLAQSIARPEFQTTAAAIIQESMRVKHGTPLKKRGLNLVLVDDLVSCPFLPRTAPAIALPKLHGYETRVIDAASDLFETTENTVLQVFVRGNPLKSTAGYITKIKAWLKQLEHQLEAVIIYGSPYVAESLFLELPNSITTLFCYGQMPMAQSIALTCLFDKSTPENPTSKSGMFI